MGNFPALSFVLIDTIVAAACALAWFTGVCQILDRGGGQALAAPVADIERAGLLAVFGMPIGLRAGTSCVGFTKATRSAQTFSPVKSDLMGRSLSLQ